MLIESKEFPLNEELGIEIYDAQDDFLVRIQGDYEVGHCRFFLTAEQMVEVGEWLMEIGTRYVSQ